MDGLLWVILAFLFAILSVVAIFSVYRTVDFSGEPRIISFNVSVLLLGTSLLELLSTAGPNPHLRAFAGALVPEALLAKRVLMQLVLLVSIIGFCISIFARRQKVDLPFMAALLVAWFGNYVLPAVGGTVGGFSVSYIYAPLVLLWAVALSTSGSRILVRSIAYFGSIVMFASVLTGIIYPEIGITASGTTFLDIFGGRLNGVMLHPNALAQIALLIILISAYDDSIRVKIRWIMAVVSIIVILLSQSKTVIAVLLVLMMVGSVVTLGGRNGRLHPILNAKRFVFVLFLVSVVGIGLMIGYYLVGRLSVSDKVVHGIQTMTGRTIIWSITLNEFFANPAFGYGPDIWNEEFRARTGLLEVGQAHNQWIQSLGSAGMVGLSTILLFVLVLLFRSIKAAIADGNQLPLLMLTAILIFSVSESPFRLSHPMQPGFIALLALLGLLTEKRSTS